MRIIGIHLYSGYNFVVKNLSAGWYPFGEYQEPNDENDWQWMTPERKEKELYCNKLYKSVAEDDPFSSNFVITVNAIVGKNGSGKTTLLEIYYRIINNFSYLLLDKAWVDEKDKHNLQLGHELHYAEGLKATLFFETDGNLGMIVCDYDKVNYCIHGKEELRISLPSTKIVSSNRLKQLLNPFFYTVCSNYSIYSLNVGTNINLVHDEALDDNKEWIRGILHKNDGYLAPIVIVPYREFGEYIDVNKENLLAHQRLSTLALLYLSQNKPFMAGYEPAKIRYVFKYKSEYTYKYDTEKLIKENIAQKGEIVIDELEKTWRNKLGIMDGYSNKPDEVKNAILNYLVYKTLKVCLTYPEYGVMLGLRRPNEAELINLDEKQRKVIFYVDLLEDFGNSIVDKIMMEEEPSHITLKIHQMLEYIKRDLWVVDDLDKTIDENNLLGIKEEKDLKELLAKNLRYDNEYKFKKKKKKRYESYDDVFMLTPPAIFDWEMLFRKKGTKSYEGLISLDDMSSGERQIMHSFSYILYHIKNLQSVKETKFHLPYHHVSLIFDEAELYYHPEFQRDFIKNIIQMLAWCHIDGRKIKSVNITVVTHSPFVLSDVMCEHTLNLDEGEVMKRDRQTFGANIHELLYDKFINDSIGAVVRKAINTIVELYQKYLDKELDKELFSKNFAYYYSLALTIAEPFLQKNLLDMLAEMSASSNVSNVSLEKLLQEKDQLAMKMREIDDEIKKRQNR